MWKLILLSILLIVEGADIRKFYGTWTQVAFFPTQAYIPVCIQYVLKKDNRDLECTCTDGKSTTMVEMTMMVKGEIRSISSGPILAVDTLSDVAPSFGAECNCGEEHVEARGTVRLLDNNYFVMYDKSGRKEFSESEPNNAYLFAKTLPTAEKLDSYIKTIEDLKDRKVAFMCSSDMESQ